MAEAVSCRPLTAETRVSPRGICGGRSGTGSRFFLENFGFPLSVSFHRCSITSNNGGEGGLIIFITGLHSKPQGCGASVASAAGPFIIKKKLV
jgi:hypothetical protein